MDLTYRVDRIPGVDEKAQADSVEISAGGPALNAAVTAAVLTADVTQLGADVTQLGADVTQPGTDVTQPGADVTQLGADVTQLGADVTQLGADVTQLGADVTQLGADVSLLTAVGGHPLGELIRDDLHRHGVTLIDAAPDSASPPPLSAVTVDSAGGRTIVSRNAGDVAVGVPSGVDLGRPDAVLVDGHHPALALAAARAARTLIVDAGTWRPVFAEILPLADLVACSAEFRPPGAAGDDEVAAAVRAFGVRHVVITHGSDPVRWWSGAHSGEIAVPQVAVVDTAGAGDAFHGALAVAVAHDPDITDLPAALGYAVTVAGVRVQHRGSRDWLRSIGSQA